MGRGVRAEELEGALGEAQKEIARLHAELEAAAGRDTITGLHSMRRLRTQLDVEVDRARRHGRPLSVAVIDVDGFRALNTRYGYSAGDEALRAIASAVKAYTRGHDVCARIAADEFAVLMPETDEQGARACMERLLMELEVLEAGEIKGLSASAGIAVYDRIQTPAQLIEAAADGVDAARAAGGSQIATAAEARAGAHGKDSNDIVSLLATTLGERDRYTGDHSEEVVELTAAIARTLGLGADEVAKVQAAALLHDIGKVGIPDDILHKPGALDEEQWKVMREHPVIGERILRAIPGLGGIARIVRHEHERFDGGGYPDGIAGQEIPIGARIILACDAYHAMTSDRPYRKAMPHADAVRELTKHAGTQFDPDVVEALIGHLYGARQGRAKAGAPAPS